MIAFVDIETTGLDPVQHEPIEVGIVLAEHSYVIEEIEFSLKFDEAKAEPRALEINGWGQRKFAPVLEPVDAQETISSIFEYDSSKPVLFCAWHAQFDETFLDQWYKRVGLATKPWGHRDVVDLPSLIMGRKGVVSPGSSRDLLKQLGLDADFEGRHTALADARMNHKAYCELNLWEV